MKQSFFKLFDQYPEIVTVMSERSDGVMRVKTSDNERLNILSKTNREALFEKLNISLDSVVRAVLSHGTDVAIAIKNDEGKILENIDSLLTQDSNLFLSITVADCLPVFFYDPHKNIIALAHAGWRGLAGDILTKTVKEMQQEFNCGTKDILVGIGAGIGPCHYEVQKEVADKFENYNPSVLLMRDNKTFLDLKKVAHMQLQQVGIQDQNIEISDECTYCLEERYFSYRRDKPKYVEPMIVIMGRRK